MVIDCRKRLLLLSQLMHSIVRRKITYGVWRSNVDVDRAAKCNDSLFRFSFTPNLSYAADDLLLVDSLSRGIVIPAEYPHIRAAFSLCSKEAPLLKSVHLISFASNGGTEAPSRAEGLGIASVLGSLMVFPPCEPIRDHREI